MFPSLGIHLKHTNIHNKIAKPAATNATTPPAALTLRAPLCDEVDEVAKAEDAVPEREPEAEPDCAAVTEEVAVAATEEEADEEAVLRTVVVP